MTAPLDPELLAAVSQSVEAQLGLHFPPERWPDLERGLRAASAELGDESVEKRARSLVLAKLDRSEVEVLAAHLTVGETYFFRDPAAFDALTSRILPALVEERRGRAKGLRIWSAGCCSGEEPYSLAITLRRAIPDLDDWQVTLLATDINPRNLQKAVAGIYGPWSFRGVPEEMQAAHFRRTPDGRSEILPAIRRMVTFACLNLVEDVYPSIDTNTNAMDLIFCRNVLMYFSPAQMRGAVANLRRALVPGGQLAVSAAEASRELFGGFVPAEVSGITLYRKVEPAAPPAALPPAAPVRSPVPVPTAGAPDHAEAAHRLANEGRLAEALVACDRALVENKLVAGHHYLRGVILQDLAAPEEAAVALRRALFIEPDFILAHFALGHLLLRSARERESARSLARARDLLQRCAPEMELPWSDGLTAGRLLAMLGATGEVRA